MRRRCPASSGTAPIGSDGTIHAPRRIVASQMTMNAGLFVEREVDGVTGADAVGGEQAGAATDDGVELAVRPLGHVAGRPLEAQERRVLAAVDGAAPTAR